MGDRRVPLVPHLKLNFSENVSLPRVYVDGYESRFNFFCHWQYARLTSVTLFHTKRRLSLNLST